VLKYIVKTNIVYDSAFAGNYDYLFFRHASGSGFSHRFADGNESESFRGDEEERLRALYELDKPIHIQYWSWFKKISHGDLGTSFSTDHRPVAAKIMERLPITILDKFTCLF
jgi:ABC-type dipeptide/oligopeptide/nickel transport system permease component